MSATDWAIFWLILLTAERSPVAGGARELHRSFLVGACKARASEAREDGSTSGGQLPASSAGVSLRQLPCGPMASRHVARCRRVSGAGRARVGRWAPRVWAGPN